MVILPLPTLVAYEAGLMDFYARDRSHCCWEDSASELDWATCRRFRLASYR
jgi:hypothetical protein